MKYIKTFELFYDINNYPKIGDYVLINVDYFNNKVFNEFINNTIGVVFDIQIYSDMGIRDTEHDEVIVIYDENIPDDMDLFFFNKKRAFKMHRIVEFGKTPEELELKIASKNYNL